VGRELKGSTVCRVDSGGRRKKEKMGRAAARLKKKLGFFSSCNFCPL